MEQKFSTRVAFLTLALSTLPSIPVGAGTGTIDSPPGEVVTISSSILVAGTVQPDTARGEAFPVQVTVQLPEILRMATNQSNWGFAGTLRPGQNLLTGAQFSPTLLPGHTGGSFFASVQRNLFYDPSGPTGGAITLAQPQAGGASNYNLPMTVSWNDSTQHSTARYTVTLKMNGQEIGSQAPGQAPVQSVTITPTNASLIQGGNLIEARVSENPGAIENVTRELVLQAVLAFDGTPGNTPVITQPARVIERAIRYPQAFLGGLPEWPELSPAPAPGREKPDQDFLFSMRESNALDQIWEFDLYRYHRGEVVRLTNLPGTEGAPVHIPGRGYLFSHSVDQKIWNLYLLREDFTGCVPFLVDPEISNGKAELSPDGTTLLFTRKLPGEPYSLWLMNLTSGAEKILVRAPFDLVNPLWMPEGEKILCVANLQNNLEIFQYDLRNDQLSNLTQSNASDRDPAVSPDGRRVIYSSRQAAEQQADLILLNLETMEKRVLLDGPAWDRSPLFLPSGREILFISAGGGRSGFYRLRIEEGEVLPFFNPGKSVGGILPL